MIDWNDIHSKGVEYYQIPKSHLNFILESVPLNGHLLDVGCGKGELVSILCSKGYVVTGLDISIEAVSSAKKNVPNAKFECIDAETFELVDKYNVVFLNLVLQFLKEKYSFLEKIKKVSEKVVVVVPVLIEGVTHDEKSLRIGMDKVHLDNLLNKIFSQKIVLFESFHADTNTYMTGYLLS